MKLAGVEMRIDEIPSDLVIRCRQVQISQILLNLLGNACDAISDRSVRWIQISAEKTHDGVRILVTDSGDGIPKEVAAKLFQPFFTTKERGKGTGLGLSISQGIVKAHSGSLAIDSNCKSTRFVLFLPDVAAVDADARVA